jgi:hypothetical protein
VKFAKHRRLEARDLVRIEVEGDESSRQQAGFVRAASRELAQGKCRVKVGGKAEIFT